MRYVYLILWGIGFSTHVYADPIDDVAGLRAAVNAHEAALLSGDNAEISATVVFPHVQFYPDGRVVQIQEPSDLPNRSEAQRQWRVSDVTLVAHDTEVAIVRASFERTGSGASSGAGAGLWCFIRRDGAWLVYWRHYLGRDANG